MMHKEQVIDVILLSVMMSARGIYLKRRFRLLICDLIICGLVSWFMKMILNYLNMDGALSGLTCILLGYIGSGNAFRLLRSWLLNGRQKGGVK